MGNDGAKGFDTLCQCFHITCWVCFFQTLYELVADSVRLFCCVWYNFNQNYKKKGTSLYFFFIDILPFYFHFPFQHTISSFPFPFFCFQDSTMFCF